MVLRELTRVGGYYPRLIDPVHLPPVHQPPLLDEQPPPHVAVVEVIHLLKVIAAIDKTENNGTDDTEGEDDENDVDFGFDEVISENHNVRKVKHKKRKCS